MSGDIVGDNKRFFDAIRRNEQKCYECKHARFEHDIRNTGTDYCNTTDDARCYAWIPNGETVTQSCTCADFVPTENLDYVEWLAKKRNLI
jgi:hypothetical protein